MYLFRHYKIATIDMYVMEVLLGKIKDIITILNAQLLTLRQI